VICIKTSQSRFSQIQNIEFDCRYNMYSIFRNKFLNIPSTSEKEGVMISLNFGLVTQINAKKVTIYKIYVAQLLFNFMHDEYIITIVCYNLITIYIF